MRSACRFAMVLASFATLSEQKKAMADRFSPLVPMKDYKPPSDLDNNPNFYYPTDYRILNCWDCFQAQGKMCHEVGHNSLYHLTGSSDPGNVICCKPDVNTGYCENGAKHDYNGIEYGVQLVCSQPSVGATDKFKNILTGNRNHQMFAFCPSISHKKCGVNLDYYGNGIDMQLKAGLKKKHVQSNEMRYKKPKSTDPTREYDSCHYQVNLDTSVLDSYNPKKIHIQVSSKKEMNVYIYAGKSRMDATDSVILGNEQATVGQTYSIDVSKGFLIVAYPNEDQETDFGFNYWLEAEIKPAPGEEKKDDAKKDEVITGYEVVEVETIDKDKIVNNVLVDGQSSDNTALEEEDQMLFYILCVGAAILFIAIVVLCFKCRNKGKIQQQFTSDHDNLGYPQATNENERSLQLEDMEEDQNNSNRPSLSKAAVFENDSEKQRTSSYKQVNAASVQGHDEKGQDY